MLVATYNAHRGRGSVGWFRPDRILGVVAEIAPDPIALQEAQHSLRRGRPRFDPAAIAEAGLHALPAAERPDHQGWRGNILLVRRDARVIGTPLGLRLGGMEPRGALLAVLDLGQGPIRVAATHLSLGAADRLRQVRALLTALESEPGQGLPTLLLGDLNEWRPGSGALGVLAPEFGTPPPVPTFPAVRPVAALDRILARSGARLRPLAAHDTPLARRASDHLPMRARVALGAD